LDVVDKGCTNGADTKSQRNSRNKPSGTDPFARDVGRDLEDDVRNVKYGENFIVVIAFKTEFFLETGDFCVTCIDGMRLGRKVVLVSFCDLPMLARSMKQNRYRRETVGTIYRSIFRRSLLSAAGSNCTMGLPYLYDCQRLVWRRL
jgi:hypothetical protein